MCNVLVNINASVKKLCLNSLTFLRLPERHQATLDELHVLIQWFPRVITDTNALESECLEYQATPYNGLTSLF